MRYDDLYPREFDSLKGRTDAELLEMSRLVQDKIDHPDPFQQPHPRDRDWLAALVTERARRTAEAEARRNRERMLRALEAIAANLEVIGGRVAASSEASTWEQARIADVLAELRDSLSEDALRDLMAEARRR